MRGIGVVLIPVSMLSIACGDSRRDVDSATAATRLTASMRHAQGTDLGTLTLTQAGQGIKITGHLTGLPPGEHAIHLHASGRCDAPSFDSAGGHWNPTNSRHGTRSPGGPHLGDMPNIRVGQDSSAIVDVSTPGGTFRDQNALLDVDGAAVVIHAKPDDYTSQPSGNAGDRIACGVVGA